LIAVLVTQALSYAPPALEIDGFVDGRPGCQTALGVLKVNAAKDSQSDSNTTPILAAQLLERLLKADDVALRPGLPAAT